MSRFPDTFLDDIRDRVPLSALIGQRVSWDRKKTRVAKGDYWCSCPRHGEKSASFHVRDAQQHFFCFGCGFAGGHFDFLMQMDGLSFPRAVEEVASLAGVRMPDSAPRTEAEKAEAAHRAEAFRRQKEAKDREAERERAARIMSAGQIWRASTPIAGTLAQVYFEWRGLKPPLEETELRFHPSLERDPAAPRGDTHPALIARVQDAAGKGIAVWRIYLALDGKGKSKAFDNPKMGFGPAAGGAVRLGGIGKVIGIGEGVETSLAVRELGESRPVWAGLSTSGIIGFKFPEGVDRAIVYPDGDGAKQKTRQRHDGSTYIGDIPGLKAAQTLVAEYPDRVSIADHAFNADYLEVLQATKGLPIR